MQSRPVRLIDAGSLHYVAAIVDQPAGLLPEVHQVVIGFRPRAIHRVGVTLSERTKGTAAMEVATWPRASRVRSRRSRETAGRGAGKGRPAGRLPYFALASRCLGLIIYHLTIGRLDSMSYGILAFLDDIAALTKMASASLDDIAAQSLKASTKSLGLVIDDAAVTPKYVTSVSPKRELPAIFRIAKWSLVNKVLVITPAAILLSAYAPWIITPLLMLGGLYLAFEGAEKFLEMTGMIAHHGPSKASDLRSPEVVENETVKSAIRTDFILSSEIMVLTLSEVAELEILTRIGVMLAIAVIFTIGVYGVVAVIVRADDLGLALARRHADRLLGRLGRGIVLAVPPFLKALTVIGTLAMLWVGGSLLIHGLAQYGVDAPEHWIGHIAETVEHTAPVIGGALSWLVTTVLSGFFALAAGGAIVGLFGLMKWRKEEAQVH